MTRRLAPFAVGAMLLCYAAAQAQVTESSLHAFCTQVAATTCGDGSGPAGDLIQASDGMLYGTAQTGGNYGSGSVFAMSTAGALTTLYSFCTQTNCADGEQPESGVIEGRDGNLYGTTRLGGASGSGTVFRLSRSGQLTVLHSFCAQANCADGQWPHAALTEDATGNFYGTAQYGGAHSAGTLFEITAAGNFAVLHTFCSQANCADGALPAGALLIAANGNGYGTTFGQPSGKGNGTIFQITPAGVFTTLHTFCAAANCPDGSAPVGRLEQAASGNIYGVTQFGGTHSSSGTVFAITPTGQLTTLYDFCAAANCTDGATPQSGPVLGSDGTLYGVTVAGGLNLDGVLYSVTPSGAFASLYQFCSASLCADGYDPVGGMAQASDGNFYGTTFGGGNVQRAGLAFAATVTPGLPPPIKVTASANPAKAGKPVKVQWTTANAFSANMQVCEAFVNGQPYQTVPPSGSDTVALPAGTFNIAVTCGGVESGLLTLVVR